MLKKRYFFLLFFLSFILNVRSEGTKQLWPSGAANEIVGVQFWDNADTDRQFATYGCQEEYRLNITISHTAETIYMGFNEHASTSGRGNLYFRIVDESGTVVYGPTLVPTAAGPGFISTWNEANIGPATLYGAEVIMTYPSHLDQQELFILSLILIMLLHQFL